MEIRKIRLDELQPAKYNPRVDLKPNDIEYKAIENSIDSFGYIEPIVWNKRTGNIIGGHQRYKILKAKGYTEAEVVVVDFDEDKEKAANLALNKAVGLWDDVKVDELLKELSTTEWDMKMFNFDDFDLNTCVQDTDKDNRDDEEGEQIPPVAQRGDVWVLGRHRLICGDSTDSATLTKLIGKNQIDLMVTDPPYNVDYHDRADRSIENDKMESSDFRIFLTKAFSNAYNHMRDGAPYYIFMSDKGLADTKLSLDNSRFYWSQMLVWVKDLFTMGFSDYRNRCEWIFYGWRQGVDHYFKRDRGQDTALNYKKEDLTKLTKDELLKFANDMVTYLEDYNTVILAPRTRRNTIHPTMKPVDLIGKLINNSSMPNNNVLDPFGGSGTTLIACEQLQRNCYMVEYEPHYCDCIIDRWETFTGQKAYKEEA